MEGLESSRHWNFKSEVSHPTGEYTFWRDHSVVNNVVVAVKGPSTRMLVYRIEFSTQFYTRNPSKDVYSVVLIDELTGIQEEVVKHTTLLGDSVHRVQLTKPVPATKAKLQLGEGGLTRFRLFGTPLEPLPVRTNLLKCAKIFGVTDASYGDPQLALREQREGNVMAGWESCRHSARHRLGLEFAQPVAPKKIVVDTYMHCLNPFRFMAALACNSKRDGTTALTEEALLASLPSWKVTLPDGKVQHVSDAEINEFMEKHGGMTSPGPVKYHLDVAPSYEGPWRVILPFAPLQRDTYHEFDAESVGEVSHMVFIGVPDGGVHRLGVYGD